MTEIMERFLYDLHELKRNNWIRFANVVTVRSLYLVEYSSLTAPKCCETREDIFFQDHTEITL